MSKLLVTTLTTVLAAAGCAAPTATDPIDEEPPPSSRPVSHPDVTDAVKSPSEKAFDITKPGDPRPTATEFVPDFPGGPPLETSDLFGFPTGRVDE
jgi:hypothetical protein